MPSVAKERVGVENLWATVDRLIHDLGAIRAFVDEVEADAAGSASLEASDVRGAMDDATTAITRIFSDQDDGVVSAAWEAIARAQDAVRAARVFVASARAGLDTAVAQGEQARQQGARAQEQAEALAAQLARLRRLRAAGRPSDADS
jgi:ElaB/YqjD/DUF883 family membrane-anchored ribosome-binding protein